MIRQRSLAFVSYWLPLTLSLAAVACGSDQPSGSGDKQGTGGSSAGQGGVASTAGHSAGGTQTLGGTGGTGGTGASGGTSGASAGSSSVGGSAGMPAAGTGGTLSAGNGGTGATAGTVGSAGAGVGGATAGSGTGGAAGSLGGAGASGAGGNSAGSGGTAGGSASGFFMDDFESGTVGMQPPGWDNFIAYVKNNTNPVKNDTNPSHDTLALVDATHVHGGTKAVHFHGGTSPAMITRALPKNTNKLYLRAWVYMTRQLGNQPMDSNANHETLLGIRAVSGSANDEVRFGEIKGVIGTSYPVVADNISPTQPHWYSGPSVAANQWACIEVAFLADSMPNTLHAWANGTLVHEITSIGTDQWNAMGMPANWLANEFTEAILGWQSFSGFDIDVWMDDVVFSNSPVGCGG